MTSPFRSLENALSFENLPLTEGQKQRIMSHECLSRKILKFLTCMTSKDIAFFIDSGSFLEYTRVDIFIPTILAFTAFFTYKINKH